MSINLKNFDFNQLKDFLKKNYDKDAFLYTVVLGLVLFFGIQQFAIPGVTTFSTNFSAYNLKQEELQNYIEKDKMYSYQKPQLQKVLPIKIYETPYPGMDLESASVELVEEIIKIVKETGNNRINQVNFSTQDLTDKSGTSAGDYGVLSLTLSLDSSYKSIKDMFNEIYLMKYLVVIKNVEISSVKPDNNTVNALITLDLYIKKN